MDTITALRQFFGYDSFRKNQEEAINAALNGKDTLVLMPTGGGKSLCYQLPALMMSGTCIVVSPLISLMKDQVDALRANGINAAALNSQNNFSADVAIRRGCLSGDIKLLYISPERLVVEMNGLLKETRISLIAIDEAHCISQWGHDFRPEYAQLGILRDAFPHTPIMALTATADKITRNDIVRQLKLNDPSILIGSFDRPNLNLCVKRGFARKEKVKFITNFIKARPNEPGIVYCLTKKETEKMALELNLALIKAEAYHAGMDDVSRSKVQEDFKRDIINVVCATIAFGMGIDKSNIRWVIHFNMPKSMESYYQEIGRAGRDGVPADTILFYSYADYITLRHFAEESGQKEVYIEKLDRMRDYAESNVCRRRILLNYFNENFDHDCGNCDVCQNPPTRFDGTRYVQMALSAAKRTSEKATINTIVDILKGQHSQNVVANNYHLLPTFGVGRDATYAQWKDYLIQMSQMGFIEVVYDEGNRVTVTNSGADVLYGRKQALLCQIDRSLRQGNKKKHKLQLIIPNTNNTERPPYGAPSAPAEDTRLFEALRLLRKDCAKRENVPPYMVFSDKVLHNLAALRPTTIDLFGMTPGIGEFKKNKYGQLFVNAIKEYLNHH